MVWYGWVKRGSAGSARMGQVLKGRVMRCDALLALQVWSRIVRQCGDRLGWICSAKHGVQCRAMNGLVRQAWQVRRGKAWIGWVMPGPV